MQKLVFNRLSYDEKLVYCERPENVVMTNEHEWLYINNHLGTSADTIQELVQQLGMKRFCHTLKVGDCFSGGGSIPFEAARIGANVYASDLNPVASLLTWASLNILSSSNEELKKVKNFQKSVFSHVDKQICDWKIEHNSSGNRADAYIYCNETICPECGYKVPLSPSWAIDKQENTFVILNDNGIDGFNFSIIHNASEEKIVEAEKNSTIVKRSG